MGLPMGLRIDLFFVCPMNLQGILLRVRYQMGVLRRPAIGGPFSFKGSRKDAKTQRGEVGVRFVRRRG
jgi:hypothetical protein